MMVGPCGAEGVLSTDRMMVRTLRERCQITRMMAAIAGVGTPRADPSGLPRRGHGFLGVLSIFPLTGWQEAFRTRLTKRGGVLGGDDGLPAGS
jgi:hypothetical protein